MDRSRLGAMSAIATAALLASSCGGDSPQTPPPPVAGDGGAVQIRGGERLGWHQQAASPNEVSAHTFTLFVDGIQGALSDVRCGNLAPAGYECSGRLPSISAGRHVLEVASTWNGLQSARSSALTVTVLAAQTVTGGGQQRVAPEIADRGRTACSTTLDGGCYDVSVVAGGLRDVSGFTTIADGRLLFVANQEAVRVVEGNLLVPRPAYAVDRPTNRIVGLSVDRAFERGNPVYVAWTEDGADRTTSLNISRFREVGGVLGEGATIVTGLPFPAPASAPLAVDDDGLLYLALPQLTATEAAGSAAAFNGFVLRFTSDGRVPQANPRASPVLAIGFARPTGLALDRAGRRMWVSGADSASERASASFAIDSPSGSSWPQRLEPAADRSAGPFTILQFDALGTVISVASRPDRAMYLAVKADGSESISILLLTRR